MSLSSASNCKQMNNFLSNSSARQVMCSKIVIGSFEKSYLSTISLNLIKVVLTFNVLNKIVVKKGYLSIVVCRRKNNILTTSQFAVSHDVYSHFDSIYMKKEM
jgi:hypothetical protein